MHLLFIALIFFVSPSLDVKVGKGGIDSPPTEWIQLNQLENVELGQSYWAKVDIGFAERGNYVLQGGNWYMRNIRFYDKQFNLIRTGNHLAITSHAEPETIYLFYSFHDEKDPDLFSISVASETDFLEKKYFKDVFQSGFISILSFVFLVSMFFIIRSKSNVYLHYALYILSIILFFTYQYGILGKLLPIVNLIPPSWIWILSASISFTYVLFAQSFLDMKVQDPFNYKVSRYGLLFILLIVLSESIGRIFEFDLLHQLWYKGTILTLELGIIIVFVYRIAIMKTIISNIFLIGAFILALTTLTGQIAATFKIAYETNLFVQTGLFLDVFILSIGIAVRVGFIQKAREEDQKKLIAQLKLNEQFQQEYTDKLEAQVTERTSDLNKRNRENETLLKEVHHRVKNNLQMIISLLNMQERRLQTEPAKEALSLTKNRVKSIGLIHEHLYKLDEFSKINLKPYVEELASILLGSLHRGADVKKVVDVENLMVDIDTALPVGLILNELITNSIKYAFIDNPNPLLKIKITEIDHQLMLTVMDNGKGMKASTNSYGFGHLIVNTLLESHSGSMEYQKSHNEFTVNIRLSDYKSFS